MSSHLSKACSSVVALPLCLCTTHAHVVLCLHDRLNTKDADMEKSIAFMLRHFPSASEMRFKASLVYIFSYQRFQTTLESEIFGKNRNKQTNKSQGKRGDKK